MNLSDNPRKFDFSKKYILEDDFVQLLPLIEAHIQPLSKISDDTDIWTFFFENGNTIDALSRYIISATDNRKFNKEYPFVIFDKITEQYVGTTRFYEYLPIFNTIKLGHTWYGKAFRSTGLNKRCKYLLFEFAFEKIGLERIGFGAMRDNIRSIAAMKSVGCKEEGVLRNMFPSRDGKGRTDAVLMSILKNEWYQSTKYQLKAKIDT
ncbi:GNAT family N-acetyltransferase [Aquimarina sp. ERC-38]|uniref:GNAT family N-acetyltransferase n=1 Tax=Aquimarina sp. ERC-38 TaxID=2949996 RepID=UPI0022477955|nr:GNAT family protein [Aquimarina sp. ERC-38]UZO79584.1 GNAT family N-acetyltransferase [Aquimarina sp. ERC-38]